MFAMRCGDKDGKPIITLRLEPAFGALLRQQYKHIVPGYYMSKEHWNSLYLDGDVPDDVVQTMVRESHQIILKSLSKKNSKRNTGRIKETVYGRASQTSTGNRKGASQYPYNDRRRNHEHGKKALCEHPRNL
jgi:hypothetical protein